MMNFSKFLLNFSIENKRFIPKIPFDNSYRHYGTVIEKKLILNKEEVLHLFCKDYKGKTKGLRMYFFLKNSGFNLFRFQDRTDCFFLYLKTADFNRKKALPIGICEAVDKSDKFRKRMNFFNKKPILFCVFSDEEMCFVKATPVEELTRETGGELLKK